jgi:RHS repeat-associated protein
MNARHILLLFAVILGGVIPVSAQTAVPWQTGTYVYDGAGNIKSIGAEQYRYDALGRMKTGTIATGQTQTAMYDPYGNITSLTTNGTQLTFGVNGNTNRLTETQFNVYGSYDNAGRLVSALNGTGGSFVYDDLDMVKKTTVDGVTKVHVYTASDERVLSIATSNNAEEWTLRDPSHRVLRRLQRIGTQWTWKEDDIYAAGRLIAAEVDTAAQTLHFHNDHLGTPRLITANGGTKVAFHTYYPFGAEATSPSQDSEKLKFTGHERDAASLDYMHARYYAPLWGRFLSPDPLPRLGPQQSQSFNRYTYALNNPLIFMDPDGRKNRLYVVNLLGTVAFGPQHKRALLKAVRGTPYEGRVVVSGPDATNEMVLRTVRDADRTDHVAILTHAGRYDAVGGMMVSERNLRALQKGNQHGDLSAGVTGQQLARAAADGDSPTVMIAGCQSSQLAVTVGVATGQAAFGTDNDAIIGEDTAAVIATLSALANGASTEEAAQAGSDEYQTPPKDCPPNDTNCSTRLKPNLLEVPPKP